MEVAAPFGLEPKYLDPESSVLPIRRQGKCKSFYTGSWFRSFARFESRRSRGDRANSTHVILPPPCSRDTREGWRKVIIPTSPETVKYDFAKRPPATKALFFKALPESRRIPRNSSQLSSRTCPPMVCHREAISNNHKLHPARGGRPAPATIAFLTQCNN